MSNLVPMKYPPPNGGAHRWMLASWADIPSKTYPGAVYLRRLRLAQTPWGGIYLHWIYEEDTDRHLHDHPWSFLSVILRGGYVERMTTLPFAADLEPWPRLWDRWSWHTMTPRQAHKITDVLPGTITLVITGPRRRDWGFWVPNRVAPGTNKWVSWREYADGDTVPMLP